MEAFVIVVLVVFLLLLLVTLIGHGIWVFCAWLLRQLLGPSAARSVPNDPKLLTGATETRWPTAGDHFATASHPADQQAALRYLRHLFRSGAVSHRDFDRVSRLLQQLPGEAMPAARQEAKLGVSSAFELSEEIVDAEAVGPSPDPRPAPASAVLLPPTPASESPFAAAERLVPPAGLAPTSPGEPGFYSVPMATAAEPVHALDADYDAEPAAGTGRSKTGRALASVLRAFMEEKNIRWGELISGMLIISSAVGLVISLRHTLEGIPYFQALLFMLFTAAVHVAGNYTLHRWKLAATSRGVLTIGTLLIPLSVLAAIQMSGSGEQQRAVLDPLYLLAVVVGLTSYGAMTWFASRALLPASWWWLCLVVMGPSASMLLINRLAHGQVGPVEINLLFALPLTCVLAGVLGQMMQSHRRQRMGKAAAERLLLVLGIAGFSLSAAWLLLMLKSGSVVEGIRALSPSVSLIAVTLVAAGLQLQRKCESPKLATLRVAGAALWMLGCGLTGGSLLLAWPDLGLLVAIGSLAAVGLATLGWRFQVPLLYVPACLSHTFVYLLVTTRLTGADLDIGPYSGFALLIELLSGTSSLALLLPAAVYAALAATLRWARRTEDARWVGLGAVVVAGFSLLLALFVGFLHVSARGAPWATLVLGLLASVSLVASQRAKPFWLPWASSALVLIALVQGLLFNVFLGDLLASWNAYPRHPLLVALLTHAVLTTLAAVAARVWEARRQWGAADDSSLNKLSDNSLASAGDAWWIRRRGYSESLAWTAGATSLLVAFCAVLLVPPDLNRAAAYLATTFVVWLGLTYIWRSVAVWSVAQSLATAAVITATASWTRSQGWWEPDRWWTARHLLAHVGVLSIWSGMWIVGMRAMRRRWGKSWPSERPFQFEQVLLTLTVAGLVAVAAWACLPGVLMEWGVWQPGEAIASGFVLQGVALWQAWGTLALAAVAIAIAVWDKPLLQSLALIPAWGFALGFLVAVQFDSELATATGLRWVCGLYALAAALVLGWPGRIAGGIRDRFPKGGLGWLEAQCGKLCAPTALLGGGVVVLLTSLAAIRVAAGLPPAGPIAESWLSRVPTLLVSAPPLAFVLAAVLLLAIRHRRWEFMALGAMLFQYVVSLAYLLAAGSLEPNWGVGLLVWNALGLVAYGLLWQLMAGWTGGQLAGLPWRRGHQMLGLLAVLGCVVGSVGAVIFAPAAPPAWAGILAFWPCYLAVIVAMGLVWRRLRTRPWLAVIVSGSSTLVLLAGLAGVSLGVGQPDGTWLSYHALLAAWAVVAMALAGVSFLVPVQADATDDRELAGDRDLAGDTFRPFDMAVTPRLWLSSVAGALAMLVIGLAIRGVSGDPQEPWWSFATTLAAAGTFALVAVRVRRQSLAYLSTLALVVACGILWSGADLLLRWLSAPGVVSMSLTLAACSAVGWLLVELSYQRRLGQSFAPDSIGPRVHQTVGAIATILLLIGVVGGLLMETVVRLFQGRTGVNVSGLGNLATVVPLLVLWIIALWDRRGRLALPGLYLLGAVLLAVGLDLVRDLTGMELTAFTVTAGLVAAGYVAATAHAWHFGANLAAVGQRCGIPDPVEGLRNCARWLPAVTLAWTVLVVWIDFSIVLTFDERWMRIASALAPMALAYGVVRLAQPPRQSEMRTLGLLLLGLSCVFLAWADLPPSPSPEAWWVRAVRTLVALGVMSFLYGPLAARLLPAAGDWVPLMRRVAAGFGAAVLALLVAVLGMELVAFEPAVGSGLDGGHAAVVAVVLCGLVAGLLSIAVWPKQDPLRLSERGRTWYVYLAQLVSVLLLAHLYLAQPNWFHGFLRPYWPFLLMALAMLGVGIGEVCRRRGLLVLAEPLQRTGAFLPLIPALGMWFVASQGPPGVSNTYTLVLLLMGLFYGVIGITRKSPWASAAAAVSANGALWSLLSTREFHLFEQPQLWLIPPALCILAAIQYQRRQLTAGQLAAARYACVLVIYLSSVGDMLLAGIGQTLWPPMILATLAVAGVLAGIALRIRAFMYTGTIFLGLAIVAMVGHAYARLDHAGIWWAFGIVLGVLVLTLFGVFEKNRAQMGQLIDRLQKWDR